MLPTFPPLVITPETVQAALRKALERFREVKQQEGLLLDNIYPM